jgi:hypothetical protein
MAEMMKVTGLWANKAKDGKTYLSGRLGDMRVLIFPNNYKEAENHPSHIMYFAPIERETNAASDDFIDGETGDDFLDNPAARPVSRPAGAAAVRPAPATAATATPPAGRPAARPAPPAAAPARPARQAAPPPADDFDEMDDPFADN